MYIPIFQSCPSHDTFFYLGFLSRTFTNHKTAGKGGGHLFNSSLPLPPASQAFVHCPSDWCGELTSAHSWQPGSSRDPSVSERKSLTTKLCALWSEELHKLHEVQFSLCLSTKIQFFFVFVFFQFHSLRVNYTLHQRR